MPRRKSGELCKQSGNLSGSGTHDLSIAFIAGSVAARPEGWTGIPTTEVPVPMAAAMAIVRLDELTQSHLPLYAKLIRFILDAQESDGGWGDPAVTALCILASSAARARGQRLTPALGTLPLFKSPMGSGQTSRFAGFKATR